MPARPNLHRRLPREGEGNQGHHRVDRRRAVRHHLVALNERLRHFIGFVHLMLVIHILYPIVNYFYQFEDPDRWSWNNLFLFTYVFLEFAFLFDRF